MCDALFLTFIVGIHAYLHQTSGKRLVTCWLVFRPGPKSVGDCFTLEDEVLELRVETEAC